MNEVADVQPQPQSQQQNELKGIGGWLYLVAFGVIVSPLFLAVEYLPMLVDYMNGAYEITANPNSKSFVPHLELLLNVEMLANAFMLLVSLALLYLFFSKHRWFPRVFIFLCVFSPLFLIADAWIVHKLMPELVAIDEATVLDIIRAIIYALIWVPYMLISKRVKNTF
ncbi:DUF2569 domain-containing protein [Pseudidiomarina sp. 1APR75-33.1]|uniref:DUF2569 domain-containing protein n=1 Tax=Pseudidiomarina terrestris TaxID=2820060 RepID=UPI0026508663|nr:DUF2569 domain-containing protein [Pseudidiomarina sp. 1APR75-33.1]MDN7127221.1 DUF2569 domain-containing protein [Pseudidiomarina sp. 1APR75-33.1]